MDQAFVVPAAVLAIALVWLVFSRLKVKGPGPTTLGQVSQSWLNAHRDTHNLDR